MGVISPSVLHGAPFLGVVTTWSCPLSWSGTLSEEESTSPSESRGGSTKSMSSRSHPHTVSQEPFRKDEFRWGSGSCVGAFWRFGGRILSLDGKPGDTDTKKDQTGRVGEEQGAICCSHQNPPKRVTAWGSSHMPNSSSIIEIVVECRRAGAGSTLFGI
jgi:hypothetical protein